MTMYRITLPNATFGIVIENGYVTKTAPIGKWMLKSTLPPIVAWVRRKGGKIEEVSLDTPIDWEPQI